MSNIKVFAVVSLVLFTLTGCFTGLLGDNFIDSDIVGEKKCREVLRCFNENDNEGLKKMLCAQTSSIYDIDEQIQSAMDFFEGKIVSYKSINGISGGGEAVDNGKVTWLDIHPLIQNIKTDADKVYEIRFYSYLVYAKDKDYVGISKMLITDEKGDERVIGRLL
ncbi:hypothetical protein FACS189499_10300 [Clostridia bacterium]|nr:hypothetical protein FACS189499_10300 [Clostridia bacterium]